jgi:hypothetical protein
MNHIKITAEELAEDRRMVATFRAAGMTEYEACMLTADIRSAAA